MIYKINLVTLKVV